MRKDMIRSSLRPDINVTPFIDVILVLLIIFMVTAPLLNLGIPVDLPQTKASQSLEAKDPLVITLRQDEDIFLGEEKLTRQQLLARLNDLEASREQVIYIRAEGDLSYSHVVSLMGDVSNLGFARLVLVTEPAL